MVVRSLVRIGSDLEGKIEPSWVLNICSIPRHTRSNDISLSLKRHGSCHLQRIDHVTISSVCKEKLCDAA